MLSGDNTAATGGNYTGNITVQPLAAGNVAVLSLRSSTALGSGGVFLNSVAGDAASILEVGAKSGPMPTPISPFP